MNVGSGRGRKRAAARNAPSDVVDMNHLALLLHPVPVREVSKVLIVGRGGVWRLRAEVLRRGRVKLLRRQLLVKIRTRHGIAVGLAGRKDHRRNVGQREGGRNGKEYV